MVILCITFVLLNINGLIVRTKLPAFLDLRLVQEC
jgi:hypothetical protein